MPFVQRPRQRLPHCRQAFRKVRVEDIHIIGGGNADQTRRRSLIMAYRSHEDGGFTPG